MPNYNIYYPNSNNILALNNKIFDICLAINIKKIVIHQLSYIYKYVHQQTSIGYF